MKGIFSDTALTFEALGFTLCSATAFSMAHCMFKTQVYASRKGKITHRSEPIFHEEMVPEEYDLKEALKALHIEVLKPTKSHKHGSK